MNEWMNIINLMNQEPSSLDVKLNTIAYRTIGPIKQ